MRSTKWLVVLALTLSLGAHWALLQGAAWLGMMVTYSQEADFSEAFEKTFDGEHPCKICDFVQDGKKAEKEQDIAKVECDKKFVAEANLLIPDPPTEFTLLPSRSDLPWHRIEIPPTPPPRA